MESCIPKISLYQDTVENYNKRFSLNRFLFKIFFNQLILIGLLLTAFLSYLYYEWRENSNAEVNNIKRIININFEQHAELINLIEHKFKKEGISSISKDLLNTKRYNRLLALQEGYINISNIYMVIIDGDSKTVNSQFGKEIFAILPSKDFFNHIESESEVAYQLENNLFFTGKSLNIAPKHKNVFIIVKVEVDRLIKEISAKLNLTGGFSIVNSNSSDYLISPNSNLSLNYIPQNFYEVILSKTRVILAAFLLFFSFSLIWILKTRSFFKNITTDFSLKQAESLEQNIIIQQEQAYFSNHSNHLESSFINNRKFYYDLISSYNATILDHLNATIIKKDAISISEIINNCKTILYPELYTEQVECDIKISTEKNIDQENSIILHVLLLNFLFKAFYRTPRKGTIFVNLYKNRNQTSIRIEDSGFDLQVEKSDQFYRIFCLPEHVLETLGEEHNIKIVKIPGDQANIIDLTILGKTYVQPKPSTVDGNIIHFPTNV